MKEERGGKKIDQFWEIADYLIYRARSRNKEVPVCLPHGERRSASLYRGSGGIAQWGPGALSLVKGEAPEADDISASLDYIC